MKIDVRRFGSVVAAATLVLGFGTGAEARRSVADKGEYLESSAFDLGCAVGDPTCTAFILPFSVSLGGGLSTNEAFAYRNGVVSFGSRINSGIPNTANFTEYGVPVIAPAATVAANLSDPFNVNYFTDTSIAFGSKLQTEGVGDYAIFTFGTGDAGSVLNSNAFLILRLATNGDLLFEMAHGTCNCLGVNGNQNRSGLPDLEAIGYRLGDQTLFRTDANLGGATPSDPGEELYFRFSPNATGGAVPEPATWAMMLLGFGLIGTAIRRRNGARRAETGSNALA